MTTPNARYMLGVLALVAMVHTIDRIGFAMMLQPIKLELHLSDGQLGFLGGAAYAVLNAAAALPLAGLADRRGRAGLISACVAVWSFFTAAAGAAHGLASLALARAGVGFAEAGASPASQSLIAARFPPAARAGAFSMLVSGSYAGIVVGFWYAGALLQYLGWRRALVCLGIPGLVLAAILWLTVTEPRDREDFVRDAAVPSRFGARDIFAILRSKTFLHLTMALATASVASLGVTTWLPVYYERHFAMNSAAIGFWLGAAIGLGSIGGALLGGIFSNRAFSIRRRVTLWPAFWSVLASAPCLTCACVTGNEALSVALLMASTVLGAICIGPIYATLQGLADPRLRATVASVFGGCVALIGQGGGPLLVGFISDIAQTAHKADGLRLSLVSVSLFGFWPAVHLYCLARAEQHPEVCLPEMTGKEQL